MHTHSLIIHKSFLPKRVISLYTIEQVRLMWILGNAWINMTGQINGMQAQIN